MYPELFVLHIGANEWVIRAYSLFYFFAVLLSVCGTFVYARRYGFAQKQLIIFLIAVSVAGFFGARLLHIVTNEEAYTSGIYKYFALDMEGFALSGGLVSVIVVGWLVAKKLQLDFWSLGDISVIFLGVGIVFTRIGCFLNGCCFGAVTQMPWGVQFPILSHAHQYQISHGIGSIFHVFPVHPTQLYEAMAAIIGSVLAFYLIYKKTRPGTAILVFGVWFAIFRLINMHFRVMPITFDASYYFYPTFYISVIIVCIVIFAYRSKKRVIFKK